MQRFMLNEEIDGNPNQNIIGRGSQISKSKSSATGVGHVCKKANSKVLKGGEIKCPQNQTILVVEAVLEWCWKKKSAVKENTKR